MDVAVEHVTAEHLERAWPLVEVLLAKGLATDPEAPDLSTVLGRITSGHLQLWVIILKGEQPEIVAAALTYIRAGKRGQYVVIDTLSGDRLDAWLPEAMAKFETYARHRGMIAVQVKGRAGWSRKLRDYSINRVTLEKRL